LVEINFISIYYSNYHKTNTKYEQVTNTKECAYKMVTP